MLHQLPCDILSIVGSYLNSVDVTCLWSTGNSKLQHYLSSRHVIPKFVIRKEGTLLKSDHFRSVCARFPALLHLTIHCRHKIVDENIKYLPVTLETFSCNNAFDLTDACIALLPRTLKSLILRKNNHITDAGILMLPRHLTELQLHDNTLLTNVGLASLPPTLCMLELPSLEPITGGNAYFPPGLEYLDFQRDGATVACIPSLPPSLKTLVVPIDIRATSDSRHDLPRSLTTYRNTFTLNDGYAIGKFPDMLKELVLWSSMNCDELEILPRGLQTLHVMFPESCKGKKLRNLVLSLPSTLTDLKIIRDNYLTDEMIGLLPRTLRIFSVDDNDLLSHECVSQLPRDLESLDIGCTDNFTGEYVTHLPPRLKFLFIEYTMTDAHISLLPRTLTSLELPTADLTESCVAHLPPKLTHLETSIKTIQRWSPRRPKLTKFPSTMLTLNIGLTINLQNIDTLPHASLRKLTLTADQDYFFLMRCLPPGLQKLTLYGQDPCTNECVRLLPPRLRSLYLSQNTKLTKDCIVHLPKTLTRLDLPRNPHFNGNGFTLLQQERASIL
jgi:hypothetical protein